MPPVGKTFKKGSFLFRENDLSKELYIIQAGLVRVYRKDGAKEIELCNLGKGAVFGEMALIDGRPRSASVVALEDTKVSIVGPDDFSRKTQDVPGWFYSIVKVIIQRLRDADKRLHATVNHNYLGNIAAILYLVYTRHSKENEERVRSLDLKFAKREIINILGLGLPELNQSLDELCTTGLVASEKNQIRIADLPRFARYARYLRLRSTMDGDRGELPKPAYNFLLRLIELKDKGKATDKGIAFSLPDLSELIEQTGKDVLDDLAERGFLVLEDAKSAKTILVNEARLDEFELVQDFEGSPVSADAGEVGQNLDMNLKL